MTFQRGHNLGKGRPKGSKNLSTMTKKAFLDYVAGRGSERFLDEIEKLEGPEYVKYFVHLLEFNYPKLARTELTGKDGKDLLPQPIDEV